MLTCYELALHQGRVVVVVVVVVVVGLLLNWDGNLGHLACVQKFTPQLLVDHHSVNVALAPVMMTMLD